MKPQPKSLREEISDLLFNIGYGQGDYPLEAMLDDINKDYTDIAATQIINHILDRALAVAPEELKPPKEIKQEIWSEHGTTTIKSPDVFGETGVSAHNTAIREYKAKIEGLRDK